MTLFNTSACIWLATMHLSPTNEKLWVNKWLKIKLKQANMTHLLNNILTDQLLLSFNFFLLSILLNCQSLWWDYFPSMRLFPFAPYWMTDDYSTTTVNISSQENSVFLLFYWADCRSRFIKISPFKYLPCFKFLRSCKAKIYCYIYKRTCSGSNVLTVFWKIYTFHCFYSKFMWSRFHSTFTYKYSIGMQILQIFIIMGWIQHNSISYKACVTKDHRHWFFSFFLRGGGGYLAG